MAARRSRLSRSSDFQRIYRQGSSVASRFLVVYWFRRPPEVTAEGPRLGLSVSKKLGGAVVRNRVKRRLREAVRTRLWKVGPQWDIVFNARRAVLEAPWQELEREVERVLRRCKPS